MSTLHTITIRGIDDETYRRLKEGAKQRGISMNAYGLEILRRMVGTGKITEKS